MDVTKPPPPPALTDSVELRSEEKLPMLPTPPTWRSFEDDAVLFCRALFGGLKLDGRRSGPSVGIGVTLSSSPMELTSTSTSFIPIVVVVVPLESNARVVVAVASLRDETHEFPLTVLRGSRWVLVELWRFSKGFSICCGDEEERWVEEVLPAA